MPTNKAKKQAINNLHPWVAGPDSVTATIGNCMAGSTRVPTSAGPVHVDQLEIGMHVMGITADGVQEPNYTVV